MGTFSLYRNDKNILKIRKTWNLKITFTWNYGIDIKVIKLIKEHLIQINLKLEDSVKIKQRLLYKNLYNYLIQ